MTETAEASGARLAVPFADIPFIPTRWLWPGIIPLRTPVLYAAPGGTGKGLSIAAMIAIVTNGWPWPDEDPGVRHEPRTAVLIAPEDDPNEDMRPRLEAAGANLDLVLNLTVLADGSTFTLPQHLGVLAETIATAEDRGLPPVAFTALDPLLAIVHKPSMITTGARRTWDDLTAVARDRDVAMVVSHHTTKNGKTVAGGSQLTAAARIVYLTARARDDSRARVITVDKANKISDDTQVRYRIEGDGESAHAVFARSGDTAAADPGSRAARLRLNETPAIAELLVPATPARLNGASATALKIARAGACAECGAAAGCGCDRSVNSGDVVRVSSDPAAWLHVSRMTDAAAKGAVPVSEITAQFRGALPAALKNARTGEAR